MKTAFILLAIITASILYGYPAYQLYQAEKHARLSFKQIPNNAIAHKLNNYLISTPALSFILCSMIMSRMRYLKAV